MKTWHLAIAAILPVMISTTAYAEDDPCRAMVLHSVHAEEDPSDVMRPGEVFTAVTQFVRDVHSGATRLCQHGGYYYPTHVTVAGRSVEALRLSNCKVASRPTWPRKGGGIWALRLASRQPVHASRPLRIRRTWRSR